MLLDDKITMTIDFSFSLGILSKMSPVLGKFSHKEFSIIVSALPKLKGYVFGLF